MSTPDAAAAPSRQAIRHAGWSLVRWTLSALVVAAVAGLAVLPSVLGTPERITKLVAKAVPELDADVTPGRVRLGWFGPIVLEELSVVPRNGDPTPIAVKRVEIENGLAGIILSAGDLGRVRVEGLAADIAFDREHRSNLDSILPPREPGTGAGRGPRRAAIGLRLEVEDAIVRISGPWTSDPWVSEPIDLRAALGNGADGRAVWTVEPVQLLKSAELEQTVAHEVLAYIVPVFADAARTSGRFSLRLDGATFPVGRPEDAKLAGLLQMHEVVLGPGPLVENMFRSLPFNLPPPPTIRIADESDVAFHLEDRRMWHEGLEFGVPLRKPGQRLDVRSQGSVGLDDRSLDLKLSLPIPEDLPQDRPLVAALAGKQVSLGVGGVLGEPKVLFDGSIKEAAGQVLVDFVDRLRNGPRPQTAVPPTPVPPARPGAAAPSQPGPGGAAAPPQPGWTPRSTAGPASATVDRAVKQASADLPVTSGSVGVDAAAETPRQKAARMAGDAAEQAGAKPETTEAIVDIVGDVLEQVARRRAERRAAEEAGEAPAAQQAPPRRGRLLQRLRQGPGTEPALPAGTQPAESPAPGDSRP
ncbi:MAG: hypothetical protein ACKO40_09285 [Planctomycetaceae bacterium]